MKTHYDGQKMLSQFYFFEIVQISIFTKLILKKVFINIQSKVVQLPNMQLSKETTFFY